MAARKTRTLASPRSPFLTIACRPRSANRPSRTGPVIGGSARRSAICCLRSRNHGLRHRSLGGPTSQDHAVEVVHADGTGYNSDILSAIYYAVNHGAKVINMSFNYSNYSQELANAVNYANSMGVICVAAAGNDGQQATVYPGALKM